ncbi:hypothetical protein [Thermomonospora echinospora]|nr:hypothetical protein [Thermomonospora echinospora]
MLAKAYERALVRLSWRHREEFKALYADEVADAITAGESERRGGS